MPDHAYDPRRMMERAMEAMSRSVCESREDGKCPPMVGAVLAKPDGSFTTAFRGELREGDHAEYTLIDRKLRDDVLNGAVLFTTLEPCAPDSRTHPKLSCAERIVCARVREVWVGIEDPDPTVDRKGIAYLQEKGVQVHMFDQDLQEEIRRLNKDFLAAALARAASACEEDHQEAITLSPLEAASTAATWAALSHEALETYRKRAGIRASTASRQFKEMLVQQGLLAEAGGKFVPTGFGLVLFGSAPRKPLPQAGLLATIYGVDGTEELRDFDGPLVLLPEELDQWLRDKLPRPVDRIRMRREEPSATLLAAVREGVINALVHRDYAIEGARCQLVVKPGLVEVRSPGVPPLPIVLGQLQSFTAPTLSRNPRIHYVFSRMEFAEERGLGMRTLESVSKILGVPRPKYAMENPYLVLTIHRSVESLTETPASTASASLDPDEKAALQMVFALRAATSAGLADRLGWDVRKVQRVLARLVARGSVVRIGRGRAARYEEPGETEGAPIEP